MRDSAPAGGADESADPSDSAEAGRPERSIRRDRRAVSTTVGYVLTLAIGAALLSGVVIGVGGVLDAQTDRAVHGELAVAGQSLASTLESADRTARLAEAGRADPDLDPADGTAVAVIEADLPTRVAGIPYTVEIAGDPDPAVILRTTRPDASVRIPYRSRTAVAETTLRGGPVRVTYVADAADPSAGTLAVTER